MPFFGGLSVYKIIGTNVDGGNDTLPVNHGINNIGIGNAVLQNNDTGNNNIGVGNLTLNTNVEGGNNIAIGYSAMFTAENPEDNIVIGSEALLTGNSSESVIIGSKTMPSGNAENSVVLGKTAGDQINSVNICANPQDGIGALNNSIVVGPIEISANLAAINNSIILATDSSIQTETGSISSNIMIVDNFSFSSSFGILYQNNIIIGRNFDSGSVETVEESIFIGNNISNDFVLDGAKQVQIGDPNISYDRIWIGSFDVLSGAYTLPPATDTTLGGVIVGSGLTVELDGTLNVTGGGGFAAEAVQNATDSAVSITSTSTDSVNGAVTDYVFIADTINSTIDTSYLKDSTLNAFGVQLNESQASLTLSATDGTVSANVNYNVTISEVVNGAEISTGGDSTSAKFLVEPLLSSVTLGAVNGADEASNDTTCDLSAGTIVTTSAINFGGDSVTCTETLSTADGLEVAIDRSFKITSSDLTLAPADNNITLDMLGETGAELSPDYSLSNAPLENLAVTNYIPCVLNGVSGFIPFLSVP